jgi:hypothetical protein
VAAGWTARGSRRGPWGAALRPNPRGPGLSASRCHWAVPCCTAFTYSRVCCSQSRMDSGVSL